MVTGGFCPSKAPCQHLSLLALFCPLPSPTLPRWASSTGHSKWRSSISNLQRWQARLDGSHSFVSNLSALHSLRFWLQAPAPGFQTFDCASVHAHPSAREGWALALAPCLKTCVACMSTFLNHDSYSACLC